MGKRTIRLGIALAAMMASMVLLVTSYHEHQRREHQRALNRALHRAVVGNNLGAAQAAIADGADCNATTELGTSFLQLAAQYDHGSMAELLIQRGADVNRRGPGGCTALMIAARAGQVSAAQALLENGADSAAVSNTQNTARTLVEESLSRAPTGTLGRYRQILRLLSQPPRRVADPSKS